MATDARFAIRERDECKHKLRRCETMLDEYLKTIQRLREENDELKNRIEVFAEALDQWRNAAPGEMEA